MLFEYLNRQSLLLKIQQSVDLALPSTFLLLLLFTIVLFLIFKLFTDLYSLSLRG